MKALFVLALSSFALVNSAQAEVFNCGFTEPFVDVTYDTATQEMTVKTFEFEETVRSGITFTIEGPNTFVLKDQAGAEVLRMVLDNQGSDGMSDMVYPYSATFAELVVSGNMGIGGCSSTLLPATGEN